MGPQTHEAEDLSNRLLCQTRRKSATTWSNINHGLAKPKPFPPSSSIFPEHRLLWSTVRQSEVLPWNTFFLPWQRSAQQPLQTGAGKAALTTSFIWPGIPCQAFALPLSHWNEQTSPCFCKNYQGIMKALGSTHSSHHTVLLRTAAWWKRKQNQTLHRLAKLKGFNVPTHNEANPNLSEFRIDVGLTQWVGKLGTLLLSKDFRRSAGCSSWETMQLFEPIYWSRGHLDV